MFPSVKDEGDNPGGALVSPRRDAFAALRHTNYRRFAVGWALATFGVRMQGVAVTWEVYERTGSELALGFIGLAQALPVILLALWGGHVADTRDRKTVIVLSQLAMFACAAGLLCWSLWAWPTWLVYPLLALTGVAKAFNSPARGSILPQLVPTGVFHNAVTWNTTFFQVAAIGGPVLAGLLTAKFNSAWPVCTLAALGALMFAVSVVGVSPRPVAKATEPRSVRSLLAGFSFLRREQTVLAAITLDLFAVLLGGATTLLPVFAKDILQVGPAGLGVLVAAPYAGALITAQVLAHRPPFRRAGRALLWSVAGFGVATIVFGFSTHFALSLGALLALGAFDAVSVVIRHVLVQVRTPEDLRGRVAAVNSVFIESSNELGGFESGAVAHLVSPVFSAVSGGVGTLVVVAAIAWRFPALRALGELHEPADGAAPPAPSPAASPSPAAADGTAPTPAA
jgi:MFS family permease